VVVESHEETTIERAELNINVGRQHVVCKRKTFLVKSSDIPIKTGLGPPLACRRALTHFLFIWLFWSTTLLFLLISAGMKRHLNTDTDPVAPNRVNVLQDSETSGFLFLKL